MVFQIFLHLGNDLSIMCSAFVQPENRRGVGKSGAVYSKFHPVLDRCILSLAHSEDIIFFHFLFEQCVAVLVFHTDDSVSSRLESLVMRSVFFGFLSHKSHVWYRSETRWVNSTIDLHIVNYSRVKSSVSTVRNNAYRIFFLTFFIPHFSSSAYKCCHRSIHNYIGRHMEIGDSLIRVYHGDTCALFNRSLNVCFDFSFLWRSRYFFEKCSQSKVWIDVQFTEDCLIFSENVFEISLYNSSKNDRVRNLHHRRL